MKALFTALMLLSQVALAASRLPEGPQAKITRVTADGYITWVLKCSTGVSADLSTRCVVSKIQDGLVADKKEIATATAEKIVAQFLIRTRARETASQTAGVTTGRKFLEWKVSSGTQQSIGILHHLHGAPSRLEKARKVAALALEQALDWELTEQRLKKKAKPSR